MFPLYAKKDHNVSYIITMPMKLEHPLHCYWSDYLNETWGTVTKVHTLKVVWVDIVKSTYLMAKKDPKYRGLS